jgi:hypothetical protein
VSAWSQGSRGCEAAFARRRRLNQGAAAMIEAMNELATIIAGSRDLIDYKPERGLERIVIAEAAERHFARARDYERLYQAVETKLIEQRGYALWRQQVRPRGFNRHVDPSVRRLCRIPILASRRPAAGASSFALTRRSPAHCKRRRMHVCAYASWASRCGERWVLAGTNGSLRQSTLSWRARCWARLISIRHTHTTQRRPTALASGAYTLCEWRSTNEAWPREPQKKAGRHEHKGGGGQVCCGL